MFNMIKHAEQSRKRAEESIKQSEAAANEYRRALAKNDEAHTDLMEKLDRRQDPKRMRKLA